MQKQSELNLKVRYVETDMSGRVYHSNYLMYMDLGRTKFLEDAGISHAELEKRGMIFVVASVAVKYLSPLQYGDQFVIKTNLLETKRVSVSFQQEIFKEDKLMFSGEVTLAAVSPKGRVLKIERDLFEKVV